MDINLCLQGQTRRAAEHVLALRGGKKQRRQGRGGEEGDGRGHGGEDLLQNMYVKIACAVKLLLTLK